LLELEKFIDGWQESEDHNKKGFLLLKDELEKLDNVTLEFIAREGLTYSLRAKHSRQNTRNIFVMVDVVEDRPRWLSVCFYADMITDPDEKGDFVPEGLLGEDALCFDMDEYEEALVSYLVIRVGEACKSAAS